MTNFYDFDDIDPIDDEIIPLSRDLRRASDTMGRDEARFLVDQYYGVQKVRKATTEQIRSIEKSDINEPHDMLTHTLGNLRKMESQIVATLTRYTDNHALSQWSKSICGIGPVLSAGLLAYIDTDRASSPASVWRFAGYDPTAVWNKGEKRPHNGDLKTLCWKIGESFQKVCNNPKDFYGHMYQNRKAYESPKNESGEYADQAKRQLEIKNYKKNTDAYKAYIQDKLPLGHLDERAKRHATKIFLSHYWEAGRTLKCPCGNCPSMDLPENWKPWIIAIGGHQDRIPVPNLPMQTPVPIFHPEDLKDQKVA